MYLWRRPDRTAWLTLGAASDNVGTPFGAPPVVTSQMAGKVLRALPWREVLLTLPSLALLGVALHYYAGHVADDALISFRYAEQLATGAGLEWNPGSRVEGYANFLWVLLVAGMRALGASAPAAGRTLAGLAAGLTVVLVTMIARRERERPSWIVLGLAPLPLVLAFPFQYWTAMRLEGPLLSMLLLLGTHLFVLEQQRGPRWPSALVYLALALTRLEGAVFVAAPVIYLLSGVRSLADIKLLARRRGPWLGLFCAGLAVYQLFRVWYFGQLLPNTFHAKMAGHDLIPQGLDYLYRCGIERPLYTAMIITILVLGGARSRAGALLLGQVALLVGVVIFQGGDWMPEWRRLVPALPLLVAVLAIAAQRQAALGTRTTRLSVALGLVLLSIGVQGNMGTRPSQWWDALRGRRQLMLYNLEGELTRASHQLGLWLRQQHPEGDALVAVRHSGALPFYSRLPTIDMSGANDLHIARRPGRRGNKWDADYVLARRPDYVVFSVSNDPGAVFHSGWAGQRALIKHPGFLRHYRLVPQEWSWSQRRRKRSGYTGVISSRLQVYRRKDRYQRVGRCRGFEDGSYAGWTVVSGRAFGRAPSRGPVGQQRASGFVGKYLANSYRGSDAPAGLLRSDPFIIKGNRMELLVGGAADAARAGARLVVDRRVVLQANGRDDGQLRMAVWDLTALRGMTALVELYDYGAGPWSHIMADHFCLFDVRRETPIRSPATLNVTPAKRLLLRRP